jgi:hypothetical protein
MNTVYRVEWSYYDGCDTFTSTLELFATLELAQAYVDSLGIIALYIRDVEAIENACKGTYRTDSIIKQCQRAGIPDVVFHFIRRFAEHLKVELIDIPFPDTYSGSYNIYTDTVNEELPAFMRTLKEVPRV